MLGQLPNGGGPPRIAAVGLFIGQMPKLSPSEQYQNIDGTVCINLALADFRLMFCCDNRMHRNIPFVF